MIVAKIQVCGAQACAIEKKLITAGMVGAQVQLDYADPQWDSLRKTVVFYGAAVRDVITDGTLVTVPAEVIAKPNVHLTVGVYGVDAEGCVVIPTLLADLGPVRAGANPSGDPSADETLPVWAQLQAMIGNLEDLDTTAKKNLVAAVNEALAKGGSVDAAEIRRIAGEFLEENPPADGADGGYYIPSVSLADANTMTVSFTASQEGMPAVPEKSVRLPEGPAGEISQLFRVSTNSPELTAPNPDPVSIPLYTAGFIRTDGSVSTTENAMRTDYIPITGDMASLDVTVNMGTSGYALAFFDGDKTLLAELSIPGTAENPQTIRVTLDDTYSAAAYFVAGYYDVNKAYQYYQCQITCRQHEQVTDSGLNILIFGDSITDSADIAEDADGCTSAYTLRTLSYTNAAGETVTYSKWPNLLPNVLHCKDVRNYAKNGASYRDETREAGSERMNVSCQIGQALKDLENPNGVFPSAVFRPDIVIFALGTNDTANDTYASAMGKTVYGADGKTVDPEATLEALDRTNFCEAVMWAFLTVKRAFPMALCFCVLPIQRAGTEVMESEKYGLLEKLAGRYGLIVIDGGAESGILRDLEVSDGLGAMLKDGLHPNEKGQNLMARMILTAIRRYYLPFDGLN